MSDSKPVLVLIHAFPMSSAMWDSQRQALKAVCRLLTPDMPGFGRSPLNGAVSNAEMAAGVAAELDQLGIREPVVMAGLSMGGYVSLEFVRQFPGRVRALALLATRAGADAPEQRAKREEQIRFIELKGPGPMADAIFPKLLGRTTLETRPEVIRVVRKLMSENRAEGMINALRAMAGRTDLNSLLPGIRKPALVVAGDEDGVIPLEESQKMSESLPDCEFHLISGAGHLLNLEKADEFNSILVRFLEKLT